ncbi:MAG: S-methyl-5-thioribose-1-phosphate isomerase [Gammaproteobacteria bacterium]|nr:S-methyl-5-thioribose-1-phosphate isomerase [Gammaproteobacteria bacterium]
MTSATSASVQALLWRDAALQLLDQRLLPAQERYLEARDAGTVARAIADMVVRGAPAIGIAAAYGMVLAARAGADLAAAEAQLAASRPTAVNLHWALARLGRLWRAGADAERLEAEAVRMHAEDLAANRAMGRLGASLIKPGSSVLTHCNTGALATGGHGTALGVIRSAWQEGRLAAVYHTETRPWLQGARLTAWELAREEIPAQMIADGAGAHLMKVRRIDWVIVGADRIAANGDTANKIGTYQLAVAARAHGVRFMVVAPASTFDLQLAGGEAIPIEERDAGELTAFGASAVAPAGTRVYNPVFDVTPAALIDAIVCERGVIEKPDAARVAEVIGRTS